MRRPPTVAATLAMRIVGVDDLADNIEQALLKRIPRDLTSEELSLTLAADIGRSKTAIGSPEHR